MYFPFLTNLRFSNSTLYIFYGSQGEKIETSLNLSLMFSKIGHFLCRCVRKIFTVKIQLVAQIAIGFKTNRQNESGILANPKADNARKIFRNHNDYHKIIISRKKSNFHKIQILQDIERFCRELSFCVPLHRYK